MGKPTGSQLAQKGIELATGRRIPYSELDCQAFIENIFSKCGYKMNYAGSNDMFRNACVWVGTISEAKKLGYLVPGSALFIVEHDGREPAKYKKDGIGNVSHVGMYVGENALTDIDKYGKSRKCNVVHSSSSMGRVAGSTLANAWTHVGLWIAANFGMGESGDGDMSEVNGEGSLLAEYAFVVTDNGKDVNFRTKSSTKAE